jgi:1-pyrroline-5-carboxylate dehydrogenase
MMLRQAGRHIARRTPLLRTFSSLNVTSNGGFSLPAVVGEPFLDYAPGSPERAELAAACAAQRAQVVEIPCIINGEDVFTGDVQEQVMPSDHGHVLARFHQARTQDVEAAIEATKAARHAWENMPFNARAQIFRTAADLIAGPYRAKVNATVMLGQSKTAWQAEIDSAVETVDFLRQNPNYAEHIYAQQPPLNSPNTWNRLEYRSLEGFVLAVSPFNFNAIGANLPAAPALMGNTCLWKPSSTAVLGNYTVMRTLEEAGLPPGVINFLPGHGPTIGDAALASRDFAGLHFTGSTKTFNKLWASIGNNLSNYRSYPRVVGETGGKNFHLVHSSANVAHAVNNTLRGSFEYQVGSIMFAFVNIFCRCFPQGSIKLASVNHYLPCLCYQSTHFLLLRFVPHHTLPGPEVQCHKPCVRREERVAAVQRDARSGTDESEAGAAGRFQHLPQRRDRQNVVRQRRVVHRKGARPAHV